RTALPINLLEINDFRFVTEFSPIFDNAGCPTRTIARFFVPNGQRDQSAVELPATNRRKSQYQLTTEFVGNAANPDPLRRCRDDPRVSREHAFEAPTPL